MAHRWVIFNFLIHSRLCKGRFVALIMAMLTVPYKINNHILTKFLSIFKSHLHGMYGFFGVIPIDMENWCQDHFSKIRGILC
ncbi:hypothetical protein KBTX_04465 [wastewater metagenome]|uniref:Uncharacterized protein n=2 Tax=unclassified sequences TaxID=12908 RepID=A0A5B8RJ45_9ZZZZ|nr:hypothetical protein KBTEX_04465 [uncultured organism]